MLLAETVLFFLTLINSGAILFLLVYYIITLSDLECDYLNAQECCDKLNYWVLPKYIAHTFITILLLLHGQLGLFLFNLPMFIWLTYEYFTVPQGNLGVYDPVEILNRGQLRKHSRDVMIYIGFYLIFFFVSLYCIILALLKGDPINRSYDIVTEL
ncbi:protein cornichon homolog 4 [Aricia agestis]|uniref:protein cornichon homolog 4 n=1 Tax=Aricia agestis TaxID=91739 RepID=UPI001C2082AB|nr:protein cornichon homolog 4 [Aricia agestis]